MKKTPPVPQKNTESKTELIQRLISKAQLDFACCGHNHMSQKTK